MTFRNSPIHVLERFTLRDVDDAYRQFRIHSDLDECVIIQTCNRIELFARPGIGSMSPAPDNAAGPNGDAGTDYGNGENDDGINKNAGSTRDDTIKQSDQNYNIDDSSTQSIKRTWASLTGLDEAAFEQNMETAVGHDALHHLLKLTSGLDSMVLGEEQILGQIKDSIAAARQTRASGKHLNTLFEKAIKIGTRIRNSTGIGRGGVSVGSMAVKLAEENLDDMKSKKTLLMGTGEVSTLVAKSLLRRGYEFDVTSRTMGRARAFCESLGAGVPVRFEHVLSEFSRYDVMFVATTAPYSLVTYERILQALSARRDTDGMNHNDKNLDNSHSAKGVIRDNSDALRGMMILDLSNPRTVDERVATISGIKLMNLDQISEMVEKNMAARASKAQAVESAIKEEVGVLEASMRRLAAEPVAEMAFKKIDALRGWQLQKAVKALGETDEGRIRIIDDLTREVVESILAVPMNNLRRASERGDYGVISLAERLFDYDAECDADNCNADDITDNSSGAGPV